jgi:hypothetical protein
LRDRKLRLRVVGGCPVGLPRGHSEKQECVGAARHVHPPPPVAVALALAVTVVAEVVGVGGGGGAGHVVERPTAAAAHV